MGLRQKRAFARQDPQLGRLGLAGLLVGLKTAMLDLGIVAAPERRGYFSRVVMRESFGPLQRSKRSTYQ